MIVRGLKFHTQTGRIRSEVAASPGALVSMIQAGVPIWIGVPPHDWQDRVMVRDPDPEVGWLPVLRPEAERAARRRARLAIEARSRRHALLTASDWTVLPDAPTDQAAWRAYRDALRRITDQPGFPEHINWPVSPADTGD